LEWFPPWSRACSSVHRVSFRNISGILLSTALALPTLLVVAPAAQANGNCVTYWGARGSGTVSSPYPVADQTDLDEVRFCRDKVFRQTADVVLTGTWTPIGTSGLPFTGTYDGSGFRISGLSTASATADYVGLFGATGGSASVTNTHVSGAIVADEFVGGLIGEATGTTVTGSSSAVAVSGNYAVGGLIGRADQSTVEDSSATGAVTDPPPVSGQIMGGLVGSSEWTTIRSSRASGAVTGQTVLGGLVGYMSLGQMSESFATGSVSGFSVVGGLLGNRVGSVPISDSYARGTVAVSGNSGGGLLGGDDGSGTAMRTYSTGGVTGGSNVAGFIGYLSAPQVWGASFWDTSTSGQSSANSTGTVTGVTGLATSAMTDIATYRAAGWSIGGWAASGTTWGICPGVNDGYPYLQTFYAADPCSSGPPPPPWPQAYARAHDETCLPGWSPSWAEWPNGRTGGFVCQRTLVYNQSTGQWDVRRAHTLKVRVPLA